jgi:hypothetical protein
VFAAQRRVASAEAADLTELVSHSLSRDPMASTNRRIELLDASASARNAAKTALYGAAAPAVSETYAEQVRLRPDPAVWASPQDGGS